MVDWVGFGFIGLACYTQDSAKGARTTVKDTSTNTSSTDELHLMIVLGFRW